MRRLAMTLLKTGEEVLCDTGQLDAPHPPVILRLRARGESGANEVVNESTRRRPRSSDRRGHLANSGLTMVRDVVHSD